jgi:FkbM family methyltransferase
VKFYSQLGQDRYVLENFFRGKRGGVFVDIGAYDGETYSNTLFFERSMGWSGLCVEPLPSAFAKLKTLRRAIAERVCVADFEGEAEFVETDAGVDEKMLSGLAGTFDPRHVERLKRVAVRRVSTSVTVTRLSTLLERHSLHHVDYCSIDTEGAELSILSDLDLEKFRISVFTVENNYDDARIPDLMAEKGYVLAAKLEQDYVFRRRDVAPLPRISVICAVPHGLADRDGLLRGHCENLGRQSVPVDPIYVFDAGEKVPPWLKGRAVTCGPSLTRYQAWNVALSLVATPKVMTLNLADRLAPDAAEILEREGETANAIAVFGDWKICGSQAETDAVEPCYPPSRLLQEQRMSAGAGPFDSLGPSVLWRMDAHMRAPRYPWRLREGTRLHDAGEGAWRSVLASQPHEKIAHAPFVIGHCRADRLRQDQAPYDERALLNDPGLSIL